VLDIRTVGLMAGIDFAGKPDAPGKRGLEALETGFHDHNIMFRTAGDAIAMSPPLIVTESQIGEIFDKVATIIKQVVA
jgi:beta-alanine--pyruvate transaminase